MAQAKPLSYQALINESMIEALTAQGFKVEYPVPAPLKGEKFANYVMSLEIPADMMSKLTGFVSDETYVVTGPYMLDEAGSFAFDTCCMNAKNLYKYILSMMFVGGVEDVSVKIKGGDELTVSIQNDCVMIQNGNAVYGYVGYMGV